MTCTVIGIWDEPWMEPERTERRIWKQTIDSFSVDKWLMAPDRGTTMNPEQFDTIALALAAAPGKKTFLVIPTTHEGEDLVNYIHPVDGIYVFGNTAASLMSYVTPEDDIVSIYAATKCEMFACACLSVVLYSRMLQARAM